MKKAYEYFANKQSTNENSDPMTKVNKNAKQKENMMIKKDHRDSSSLSSIQCTSINT